LSVNVTPAGNAPVLDSVVAAGKPADVVTVNVPAVPAVNVALLALLIAGGASTVSVNDCVASGDTPFDAVIVNGYVPPVPAAGVPMSVALPSLLSVNVTPLGRAPVSLNVGGVGNPPDVVTVNVPKELTVNVALSALVIDGASSTVSVNDWVASGLTPFDAVIVNEYVPPVARPGVPASVAVPSPLSVNVTPEGRAPDSDSVSAIGKPAVVVTVNEPADPAANVVLAALVITGGAFTVNVNDCVASGFTPFDAVIVNG
jgi:hypothetical protein